MSDAAQFICRFLLFALMHSVLALPSLKRWMTGRSGHLARFYRIYYNVLSLGAFFWVVAAFRESTILYVVPGVGSLLLYGVQLGVLFLLFVCLRQTGLAEFIGFPVPAQGEPKRPRLITTGWYRVVRHPLYFLTLLFLLCNPVVSSGGLLFVLITGVYFLIGALLEESRLLAEFGGEYREYQQTVPFIIPRIPGS